MLKIRQKLFVLSLLGVFCLGGMSVVSGKSQNKPAFPPSMVEVQKVQYTSVQDSISATGSLVSIPGVIVKAETSGRITNVYFQSGDEVKSGDPLIEIYPDIIKAQLADNEASLKLKKLGFARYSKLYETRTVSKSDFDQAQSDLASAEAKVQQSKAYLSQTVVKAPFAGKLGVSLISLGQYITGGQDSIVSLQSLDPIYVDFSVPEIYASQVKVGQSIVLHAASYPNDKFDGKVYAIDTMVDARTRSFIVRGVLPNKEHKLLPGFFGDISLSVGVPQKVFKIPQTAIVFSTDGNYVYRVVDGKAVQTNVILGSRDPQNVVVKSGLNEGDVVVTVGQMKIAHDGAPVIVKGEI